MVRLQAHWQGHYQILVTGTVWQARRCRHDQCRHDQGRHGQGTITAGSASELWDRLRDDYAELAEHERRLIERAASARSGPGLTSEDQTWLNFLRMHYENYYTIDYIRPADDVAACWQAVWRAAGEPGTLVADSPIGLRDMMRDDAGRRRSRARLAGGGERLAGA
jgi:hypothetical protein